MPVEERGDRRMRHTLRKRGVGVVGSGNQMQRGFNAGRPERLVQRDALLRRHGAVPVAVHQEEGRGARADIRERTRPPGPRGVLIRRAAEQPPCCTPVEPPQAVGRLPFEPAAGHA